MNGLAALAESWDVLVVGAGPAGALAAREAARRGLSTVLVEREAWPRSKVCGSYLSGRAVSVLAAVGLEDLVERAGGVAVDRLELVAGGRRARLPLSGRGRMLSRRVLDDLLVRQATKEGATFVSGVRARVEAMAEDTRLVRLTRGGEERTLCASLVLLADGLAGGADPEARSETRIARGSRIGLGAYLEGGDLASGRIRMACSAGGYVGASRVEDGRLCVAAAVDADLLERGPAEAIRVLLHDAGADDLPGVEQAAWKGTPPLTRNPGRVTDRRLLRLGDAAGYVEPFTGEGIAWALESALRVGELLQRGVESSRDAWHEVQTAWNESHRANLASRRGAARGLASLLRRPRATRLAVGLLARAPRVGALALRPLLARLDRPVEAAAGKTHIT